MKRFGIELKWALVFVLTSLGWMLLEKVSGLHSIHIDKHLIYTNFFAIPAILIYVLALLDKRKAFYNDEMTYRQGFETGAIITIVVTLASPLTQWITNYVITPEFFQNVIEYSLKTGYYKTIEEATAYFNFKSYVIQGLIGAFAMGLTTSAIVAIFTKKRSLKL